MWCPECGHEANATAARNGLNAYTVQCDECGFIIERGFISINMPKEWQYIFYPAIPVFQAWEIQVWANQLARDMREFRDGFDEAKGKK